MSKTNVPNKKGEHLQVIPHWHIDLLSHFQMSVHMDHHTGATASLMLQNALQWTIVLKSGSSNQW